MTTAIPIWSILLGGGLLLVVMVAVAVAIALAAAGRRKDG